jgi:hypothetical protein
MKGGASFESYVHYVYDSILNLKGERIQVSKGTVFRVGERETYEVDIYYEFMHAAVRHRVAVECKDWKKKIDQGQVLLFHQKIKNIGDEVVGVFISRNGYQSGAIEVGTRHGILMLTGDDLPTLPQLLAKKITAFGIPEDGCTAEPFWYIAELDESDGAPNGNFFAFPDSAEVKVPLFISRRHAEAFLSHIPDKSGYKVYAMPQYKLRGFLAAALLRNMPIGLVYEYPNESGQTEMRITDAESVNRDFLLDPIHRPPAARGIEKWLRIIRGKGKRRRNDTDPS